MGSFEAGRSLPGSQPTPRNRASACGRQDGDSNRPETPQHATVRAVPTDPFLEHAYELETLEDTLAFYARWAETYDAHVERRLGYIAARDSARQLAEHLSDRSALILDIGCGTGLTAHYLTTAGFSRFDGIDITPEMIDAARKRGIYRLLYEADLTKPLDIADQLYDAAISTGTFTIAHVGSESLSEIVRVLKRGGLFACTVHEEIWSSKSFESTFLDLRQNRILRAVEIKRGRIFRDAEAMVKYCLFEKL